MTQELETSLVTIGSLLEQKMAVQAQLLDWTIRGRQVESYRDYYDGDHPVNLTAEMRQMLCIRHGREFNDNYMQIVVDTMADRITLDDVTADEDAATTWAQELLEDNDLDELQADVHEAAIRDGETFLMPSWDNEEQRIILTHEQAFDGRSGMLILYRSQDLPIMEAAVKVWVLTATDGSISDTVRVNVYYPDRICKFISENGLAYQPYVDPDMPAEAKPGEYAWTDRDGNPLGIPVVPFRNRGRKNQGLSELANAIPLQNVLNRLLHSIVMTSELSAFPIKWIKGAPIPRDLTPGMFVGLGEKGLTPEQAASIDMGQWDAADTSQQLAVAQWVTNEIGKVTRTPAPEFAGSDNASGEALKQREIGLLGKVRRFEVKAAASWVNVLKVSWAIQAAFGAEPPAYKRFYAKWLPAALRNDQVTVDNAIKLAPRLDEQTFLELVAPINGWDNDKVQAIMKNKQAEKAQQPAPLPGAGNVPGTSGVPGAAGSALFTPADQQALLKFYQDMKAKKAAVTPGNGGSVA